MIVECLCLCLGSSLLSLLFVFSFRLIAAAHALCSLRTATCYITISIFSLTYADYAHTLTHYVPLHAEHSKVAVGGSDGVCAFKQRRWQQEISNKHRGRRTGCKGAERGDTSAVGCVGHRADWRAEWICWQDVWDDAERVRGDDEVAIYLMSKWESGALLDGCPCLDYAACLAIWTLVSRVGVFFFRPREAADSTHPLPRIGRPGPPNTKRQPLPSPPRPPSPPPRPLL